MELDNITPQSVESKPSSNDLVPIISSEKKLNNLFLVGFFILLVVLLCIGTYLLTTRRTLLILRKSYHRVQEPTKVFSLSPTISFSPNPSVMALIPTITTLPGWKTYQNIKYGFNISYPNIMKLYESPVPSLGFIPLCNSQQATDTPDSIVCLYYPQELYKDTNFEGAAVAVNVLKDLNTETLCTNFSNYASNGPETVRQINGITFNSISTAQGATGHTLSEDLYHTFNRNTCFEITVSFDTYRNDGELPKSLTQQEKNTVFADLNQVLSSFNFISK